MGPLAVALMVDCEEETVSARLPLFAALQMILKLTDTRQMKSRTAWTVADDGVPRKSWAGCTVFPVFRLQSRSGAVFLFVCGHQFLVVVSPASAIVV
jgi:hypothetical protein